MKDDDKVLVAKKIPVSSVFILTITKLSTTSENEFIKAEKMMRDLDTLTDTTFPIWKKIFFNYMINLCREPFLGLLIVVQFNPTIVLQ